MKETVKFDLLGNRRLEFDDETVAHITTEYYPVPLPGHLGVCHVATNKQLRYEDIHWIGRVRRRQWWALGVGLLFTALGTFWMITAIGDWGPFFISAGVIVVLGFLPLWLFMWGRPFLVIAAEGELISIPMDRKRRQVKRAIGLLQQSCPPERVLWEL
jgi:hypothetical protein